MRKLLCFIGFGSISFAAFGAGIMSNYGNAKTAVASPVKAAVSSTSSMSLASTDRRATNSTSNRGYTGTNNSSFRQNYKANYILNNVPDIDGTCRNKISQCLTEYCGDVAALPGTTNTTCNGASYGQLYNWTLLCLQRDKSNLFTQYQVGNNGGRTASALCTPYVQQELSSYLAMSEMADNLSKAKSSQCVSARNELEAAIVCHEVALTMGTETANKLTTELNSYCGDGASSGGSALMVQKFANAGNAGANVWEWVDKAVNLDFNKKGSDWKEGVDAVLAGYVNRMNLACGENFKVQDQARPKETSNLQTVAGLVLTGNTDSFAPDNSGTSNAKLSMEVLSASPVYDRATAEQVVNAGLTKANVLVQNAFLTSAQMQEMQDNYTNGTKVFVLRDGSRCFTIVKVALADNEQRLLAQQYSNCVAN